MKRWTLGLTLFCAFGALQAGSAAAQNREVRVYNWSDYIDNSIIEDFQKETGIRVIYDVFDSNEIVETKLLAGGSGYDIVVPTANFLERQIQAGVFQKLDKSKIPNLENMWDVISERVATYDPGNEYSVDYMWGTTGLGYNVTKLNEIAEANPDVKAALSPEGKPTWDILFKPELAAKFKDCGIHILDSATDALPSVMRYLNIDPNTTDAAELKRVEETMVAIRPSIRKFHSSEYINGLANGDICLALGYSGDVFQARDRAAEADRGVEVGYSIPPKGAQMWFDLMAIPADARNVEEAHEFINYMMKPEVIAKASNYVFYANGNKASQEFIDDEILQDTAIYPPEDVMNNLFTVRALDPRTQRVVTRLWTTVITGQ